MVLLSVLSQRTADNLQSLAAFGPEWSLALCFLICLACEIFTKRRGITYLLALIGLMLNLVLNLGQIGSAPVSLFNGLLHVDGMAIWCKSLVGFAALLAFILLGKDERIRNDQDHYSGYILLFPALTLAMNLLCLSVHLGMIYIAVEFVSLCSYLLVGLNRSTKSGSEAGIKYVLFGAASSAILLYGISLLFGLSSTLQLNEGHFLAQLSKAPVALSTIAILLVLGGIFFKLSAVPFHFWAPDVYEGSPIAIATLLSTAPKIAGFALLAHFTGIFSYELDHYSLIWPNFPWQQALAIAAILSMTIGNFSAIGQSSVKRLLAWSSVAHTGFLLLAPIAFTEAGSTALGFYLLAYVLMNTGAWACAYVLEEQLDAKTLEDYKGLGSKAPLTGSLFVIFLLSLIGLPLTAGFIGKFLIFSSLLDAFRVNLNPVLLLALILGVINTVLALFYYFRIPLHLFLRKGEQVDVHFAEHRNLFSYVLIALALAVLFLGLFPTNTLSFLKVALTQNSTFFFQP